MKLTEGELKIYYRPFDTEPEGSGIYTFFKNWMETALTAFGYKRWASGIDTETGVRDLAFDKKK